MKLFSCLPHASVNRPIPKAKIYEASAANTRLRELFALQVEQIVWRYKLAPETIGVAAGDGVLEIQVFDVVLKTGELDEKVLRAIDEAVGHPIFFRLRFEGRVRVVAAYKRASEAAAERWVVGRYFWSDWLVEEEAQNSALPVALDLASLYQQLLRKLLPVQARQGEDLRAQLERIEVWERLKVQRRKLETRMNREKQYNRKVALNRELRALLKEIEDVL